MSHKVTSDEVATQFSIALELLLKWINQGEISIDHMPIDTIKDHSNNPNLLTAPEVARILKISKSYAYRLIQRGDIRSVRVGRSVRVREEDLLDFISNQ